MLKRSIISRIYRLYETEKVNVVKGVCMYERRINEIQSEKRKVRTSR